MSKSERSGHTTTDHEFIRSWVEERGGWPACVRTTGGGGDVGVIRIDFPGYSGDDRLERITWDEWFEKFEESGLALLHRDMEHKGGDLDRFNKLVRRNGDDEQAGSQGSGATKNGGNPNMAEEDVQELRELLLHEMGDLLYAERRFLTATRQLVRETQDDEVKQRLEEHVRETEVQIERLGEAFEALGERAKAVRCEGAIGLREEHDSFKKEEKPSKLVLEVFDLGAALRVEHYEIAGYTAAALLAEGLGETACAELLRETLEEEEAMAAYLRQNGPKALRRRLASING